MGKTKLGNTTVVHVCVNSEVDDCTYEGDFTIKRQGLMDFSRQQLRKLELNGGRHRVDSDGEDDGAGVPFIMDWINEMISTIEVAVVKSPDWFDLSEISDMEVLKTVYKEVTVFENTFLNRGRGVDRPEDSAVGDGPKDSSPQRGESNAAADVDSVVGKEVPASLQP